MASVCPICRDETICEEIDKGTVKYFDCQRCGYFGVSGSLLAGALHPTAKHRTPVQHAALSHKVRAAADRVQDGEDALVIDTYMLKNLSENLRLPSPAAQATNILAYFGDQISESGQPVRNPGPDFVTKIGAANRASALRILGQLADDGLLLIGDRNYLGTANEPDSIDLSLRGWDRWEAEKRGEVSGSHGFMALKFDNPELDAFQRDVIKPAVRQLGYELEDMRDAAQAGVIDNVMRAKIRDAAFVLVDLTHGSAGAYWEAGYAEGLGKPVLYLCEKSVFDENGTHFDTNHCTTVKWSTEDRDTFTAELVATLRRSLGLFQS